MPPVLNLNNEVVKLRAEVKRVRVLIIRKLIRQISVLEKKKGSEADLEKHRRRVARLLEEIKELKVTVPDKVTKTALHKDISFEKVCKDTEASLADRAIARIATHPQFNKKIQNLKDAIKAFKDERINTINSEKKAKKNADILKDQPQEDSDDECPETLDDEEKKLNEEEGNQMMEKPHEDSSVDEVLLKMRREVKTVRVLVLGKLTRKLGVLKKKKKGDESEVKITQESIAQLMKDIQALRSLKPDEPTMTALEQNIELEKVLQDPQASPKDRVIAHIITQSRFINKLQKVKNRIEENKAKAAEAEQIKKEREMKEGMVCVEEADDDDDVEEDGDVDSEKDKDEEDDDKDDDDEEDDDNKDDDDDEEDDDDDNKDDDDDDVVEEKLSIPSIEIHKPAVSTDSDAVKLPPIKVITTPSEKSRTTKEQSKVKSQNADATTSPKKSLTVSNTESKLPMNVKKTETENTIKPQTKASSKKDDEESDLSDDDGEKEYFDDSTEERFRKQSSQSEESDDDDFFLSKVSKFKKRKSSQAKVQGSQTTSKPQETNPGKLASVFCSTLSKSSTSSHGSRYDGPRPPRFQKKGPEGRMKPSVYKDPGTDRRPVPFKPNKQTFKYAGKRQDGPPGAGRGRSQFEQRQNPRGPPGKISNPPQQSLHPSWEASRKRKEQQTQITAFQGKKIRFDDDD